MLTVGIDTVSLERFEPFLNYSRSQLLRLYSPEELDYCFKEPLKKAERLAARFAAKEAFYKALMARGKSPLPFLTACTSCSVTHDTLGSPFLILTKKALYLNEQVTTALSITHSGNTATALVIIQSI